MYILKKLPHMSGSITVSEKKTATRLLRTPGQASRTSPLVIEAAGQIHSRGNAVFVRGRADNMPEIKRRARLAWACYSRFKRDLYDMEAAPFTLKVRMLKAEVMGTLL